MFAELGVRPNTRSAALHLAVSRTIALHPNHVPGFETVPTRLREYLARVDVFTFGQALLVREQVPEYHYWSAQLLAFLSSVFSRDDFLYAEAERLVRRSKVPAGVAASDVRALEAHIRAIIDSVDQGLLERAVNKLAAEDFAQFLEHARDYQQLDKKIESAVIASAVFEDVIRRVCDRFGIKDASSVEQGINALKAQGLVSAVEAKRLKYCAGIRNAAFHANWDEIDLAASRDLIDTVAELIEHKLAT